MADTLHIVCPACSSINSLPRGRLNAGPKCGKCKSELFTGHPVELNSSTFAKSITRSSIPVVVDFWAPWCGPCKMMAPAFAQAAAQMEPSVRFTKLNTDEEQDIARQFNIMSIPTLAIFKGGREIARQAGALDAGRLVSWIKSYIQ